MHLIRGTRPEPRGKRGRFSKADHALRSSTSAAVTSASAAARPAPASAFAFQGAVVLERQPPEVLRLYCGHACALDELDFGAPGGLRKGYTSANTDAAHW